MNGKLWEPLIFVTISPNLDNISSVIQQIHILMAVKDSHIMFGFNITSINMSCVCPYGPVKITRNISKNYPALLIPSDRKNVIFINEFMLLNEI